jgi:cytochrome P450
LRPQYSVVRNVQDEWVVLSHAHVTQVALDAVTFSSAVSRFRQVPNGLDGAEHAAFRELGDRFLTADALTPYQPKFDRIAAELAVSLPRSVSVEAVREIGAQFAVRAQSAWLGWPLALEGRLMDWIAENHAATRSGEIAHTRQVAQDFDAIIESVLASRRGDPRSQPGDVTSQLMRAQVGDRPLSEAEIVSVLRNWTGGDLGSIALCVGVLVHFLASHTDVQDRLRAGVSDQDLDATIDEVLRIDDPFVTNRRITTCPAQVGSVPLPKGARIKLNWTSANRDESVFGDPDVFDPTRNAKDNLVYGIGKHVCPGRLLATVELRTMTRALLAATESLILDPARPAQREVAPVGGWRRVPVILS